MRFLKDSVILSDKSKKIILFISLILRHMLVNTFYICETRMRISLGSVKKNSQSKYYGNRKCFQKSCPYINAAENREKKVTKEMREI